MVKKASQSKNVERDRKESLISAISTVGKWYNDQRGEFVKVKKRQRKLDKDGNPVMKEKKVLVTGQMRDAIIASLRYNYENPGEWFIPAGERPEEDAPAAEKREYNNRVKAIQFLRNSVQAFAENGCPETSLPQLPKPARGAQAVDTDEFDVSAYLDELKEELD